MQNIIYFNENCKIHAKEYAEGMRAQELANKINNGVEKAAIVMCVLTSVVAVAIMAFVCLL